jgi:ABC-2 type transport system permease protein
MIGASGGLGLAGYLLFSRVPAVLQSRVWMAFFLALYFFLIGIFWILWPVVAAQVDDDTELGRFLHYPIHPAQLYLVQTLAALLAPSAFFFFPALVGAGFGLSESLRPGAAATLLLMTCYALMCVTVGRALLNLFLNVMAHRRSAELLFSAFLVGLALAAVLPPVDASWLTARFADLAAASPEDLEDIRRAAHGMTDTPPGWIAHGLRAAARGYDGTVLRTAAGMLLVAGLAWGVGLFALLRFYRGARRLSSRRRIPLSREPESPLSARRASAAITGKGGWRLPGLSGPVAALFERELRSLLRSPKGRLLFAMPFFLLILLRLVGAAPLFAFWLGPEWTSQLLMALCVYVLGSLAGQFFVNQFGYDGQAVRLIFLLPPSPRDWLLGRNLAHAVFALGQFLSLVAMAFVLLPGAGPIGLELPILFFPFGLLVLLGVGNFLSLLYPRRFVFSLTRRDRPAAASFGLLLGALAATVGVLAAALRVAELLGAPRGLFLLGLACLASILYIGLLPTAARELGRRREELVSGVTAS